MPYPPGFGNPQFMRTNLGLLGWIVTIFTTESLITTEITEVF